MEREKSDYAQERQVTEAIPWLQGEKGVGQGGTSGPD